MIVSIHQPDHLPWLPYFDKVKRSDTFVILDEAQYVKNKFMNRNRVRTSDGWTYITIPIEHGEHFKRIRDVRLPTSSDWRKKILRTLEMNYSRAPFFLMYRSFFDELYRADITHLSELNITIIRYLTEVFDMNAQLVRASDLPLDHKLKGTEWLISILNYLGATNYISGPSGRQYLDLRQFERESIKVEFQQYEHRVYTQRFPGFVPGLSAADLLFNCGPKAASYI